MANIKSQKKRILISRDENARNISKKSAIKTLLKKFDASLAEGDYAKSEELYKTCVAKLDSAKSDGLFHINTVSRKKANLAKKLNALKA